MDIAESKLGFKKPKLPWSRWDFKQYKAYQDCLREIMADQHLEPLRWEFKNWLEAARGMAFKSREVDTEGSADEKYMGKEGRYLLLQAICANWGLKGPGSLRRKTYRIYSDGTFSREDNFILDDEDGKTLDDILQGKTITIEGQLSQLQMTHIISLLSEDWLNPDINSFVCDGAAWQIKQYYPSGKTKKTTGELRHIYRQPIERLADYIWKACE